MHALARSAPLPTGIFARYTAAMLSSTSRLGGIEEVESGLRWDAARPRHEIARRAAELSRLGVRTGSRVAIVHGGSADFFADLLAVWRMGATAVCLDPALTSSELANVIGFAKPIVALVSSKPVPTGAVPAIDLARSGSRSAEASVDPPG